MSDVQELERSITAAHTNGDTRTLERLQAEYRKFATTRVTGPEAIRIVERSQTSTIMDAAAVTGEESAAPSVIVIRPEARSTVINDFDYSAGMECGGLLVGHEDMDAIVVETVWGADDHNYVGERDSIRYAGDWCSHVDARARRAGWRLLGDVHSHRHALSDPSPTDVNAWRGLARGLRRTWLAVLITPDANATEDAFARPRWRGFIATPDGSLREVALQFELAATEGG